MKPYNQGALDGLCGVYSIINAARIVNDAGEEDCEALFESIMVYLNSKKNLSKTITEGLNINVIGGILRNIKELKLNGKMPFRGRRETGLPEFWASMQEFLEQPHRALILGLDGIHEHWSVVEQISNKRITFFDSDGIKHINRQICTTQKPTKKRIHQISPIHTYFLSSAT